MHELNFHSRLFQSALKIVYAHLSRLSGSVPTPYTIILIDKAYIIRSYTRNGIMVPCACK